MAALSAPHAIPHVVLLSGNTHRPSKSRGLATAIADRLAERIDISVTQLDLVDAGPGLGSAYSRSGLTPEALGVVETLEGADALVVTTPVYKGSYPGLFKHLIDLIDVEALANKPVPVGATGGGHRHALVVEHQLRPLFGFFSALVSPTSLYVSDGEFADGVPANTQILDRLERAVDQFAGIIDAQSSVRRSRTVSVADHLTLAVANA